MNNGLGFLGTVAVMFLVFGLLCIFFTDGEALILGFVLLLIGGVMIWAMIKKEEIEKRETEERKKKELLRKEAEKEEEQYALAHLHGLAKYAQIERMEDAKAREGIAAVRTLGAMMQESAIRGQKAEKDWAVLGGIANGIAGPVAGVATAIDAMQENAKTRASNTALLQEGVLANIQYQQMARTAEANLPHLSSMAELNSRFDVVTSWAPNTLHSFISFIQPPSITVDKECGAVSVFVRWEQKERSLWIDGAFRAKLYVGTECVGCAYLVLPKNGTATKHGSLAGVCAKPKKTGDYRVVIEPVDLWEFAFKGQASKLENDGLTPEEHCAIVANAEQAYLQEVNQLTKKPVQQSKEEAHSPQQTSADGWTCKYCGLYNPAHVGTCQQCGGRK